MTLQIAATSLLVGSFDRRPSAASKSNSQYVGVQLEKEAPYNEPTSRKRPLPTSSSSTASSTREHEYVKRCSSCSFTEDSVRTEDDNVTLDEDDVLWMLNQLTEEELEQAAGVSYAYTKDPSNKDPCAYAAPMAQRYLQSKKNAEVALEKMKATLKFRQAQDLNGLRQAMEHPTSPLAQKLESCLESGKNYVMCYDNEGRSTHIFVPSKTVHHDAEWTLKEALYTMERAIACSKSSDGKVNAILDFRGFSACHHAPPLSVGKEFLLALRHHYAGHVHKIFILDAPRTFQWVWNVFKKFVGTATQDKIVFCSGKKQKQQIMSQYYSAEQSTPWMRPQDGRKCREFDCQEYLYKTPFDEAFDE